MNIHAFVAGLCLLMCCELSLASDDQSPNETTFREIATLLGNINSHARSDVQLDNNHRLLKGLVVDMDIFNTSLYNLESVRKTLLDMQEQDWVCQYKRHIPKKTPGLLYVGKDAIPLLTDGMLIRIHLLLEYLKKDENVYAIGAMIERDLFDINNPYVVPTEIGGYALIDGPRLAFLPIADKHSFMLDDYFTRGNNYVMHSAMSRSMYNHHYTMPEYAIRDIPHIAMFHLHATRKDYENKEPCGPSIGYQVVLHNFKDIRLPAGDVGVTYELTQIHGEHHSIVISNVATRTFAIHYLAGFQENEKTILLVVNLPLDIY